MGPRLAPVRRRGGCPLHDGPPERPDAELSAFALDKLVGVDPASVDLSLVRETVDGTDFVTINATFQFQYVASLITGEPFILTGSSRAPLLE